MINGFKPPGDTWVELPVLFSRVASDEKSQPFKRKEKKTKQNINAEPGADLNVTRSCFFFIYIEQVLFVLDLRTFFFFFLAQLVF